MNINNEMPSLGSVARLFGGAVMDEVLTERVGLVVIDGRKVADGDAADFKEVVTVTFGVEVTEWLSGAVGSAWYDDCIFIGADVPEDATVFVTYHEFKHYLDFVGRGVVPSDEHASIRSSRIEKECDLYALRRVIQESGKESAEKALEWMVHYHFQWDINHPDDPSDLLYRSVLLYRFMRRLGRALRPKANMVQLQKSQRWWR